MQPGMLRAAVTPLAPARRWSRKQLPETSVKDPQTRQQHQNQCFGQHSLPRKESWSTGWDLPFPGGKVVAPAGVLPPGHRAWLCSHPAAGAEQQVASAPSLRDAVTCRGGMPSEARIRWYPVPGCQDLVVPGARIPGPRATQCQNPAAPSARMARKGQQAHPCRAVTVPSPCGRAEGDGSGTPAPDLTPGQAGQHPTACSCSPP